MTPRADWSAADEAYDRWLKALLADRERRAALQYERPGIPAEVLAVRARQARASRLARFTTERTA